MVAPNSPSALAKHSTMPAMMPGSASGSVTVANTQAGVAPSVAAADLEPPVDRFDRQPDGAHQQRKSHHAAGECGAGPAERKHDAEMIRKKCADRPAPAERDQQQIAGDDRRQHQRQMHDAVEQRLAPEIPSRQQPGNGDAERQRPDGRDQPRSAATAGSPSIRRGEVQHRLLSFPSPRELLRAVGRVDAESVGVGGFVCTRTPPTPDPSAPLRCAARGEGSGESAPPIRRSVRQQTDTARVLTTSAGSGT